VAPKPIHPRHISNVDRAICSERTPPSVSIIGPSRSLPIAIATVDRASSREIIPCLVNPVLECKRPELGKIRIDNVVGSAHFAHMTDR